MYLRKKEGSDERTVIDEVVLSKESARKGVESVDWRILDDKRMEWS